ncbi:MAG: tyrosine-protein phosphatase [Phycisphaerales bacterium]|nr:tyrosine-protein phosphatase [Phycisphaerales bacterium]
MALSHRKLAIVVLVATLLGAGGWVLRFGVRDNVLPRNYGVVDEGLVYRTGRLTPAATETVVKRHGIKTIIDLGAYEGIPDDERLAQRTAESLGVKRHVFTLDGDGTGHPMGYVEALRLITDPANQPVLIHCAAGAQRTTVCVMMYEKLVNNVPLEETLKVSMDHKHDPKDNPKLWPYIQRWAAEIERAYRDGGVIDAPEFRPYRPVVTTP